MLKHDGQGKHPSLLPFKSLMTSKVVIGIIKTLSLKSMSVYTTLYRDCSVYSVCSVSMKHDQWSVVDILNGTGRTPL